ncbi:MAG: exo-alpha-sialidase, partial [Clostridia bacterium]|nr:exo-alpha-sialidase [Clostridia bacterium]
MRPEEIRKAGFYPLEGRTRKQPFPGGRGGCESFRIPGLTTLLNGDLFASVDARWTRPDDDCGGIDVMYALSRDGGESWEAGFAAYFPDSLGSPENLADATILIDSTPVQTPDGALHIFVNLGPTGVTTALREPGGATGFLTLGGKRRLMLTDDAGKADDPPETFGFFLGDFREDRAPILDRAGKPTGFAVDGFFNLYRVEEGAFRELTQPQIDTGREIVQNVFYRDSSFHVYNTMYLLHLASDDLGATWRWELVSDPLKRPGESIAIASPGNGLVTRDGRLVLPFYAVGGGKAASFLAVSSDNGGSFAATPRVPATAKIRMSSEGKPVELPSGDIRLFFR